MVTDGRDAVLVEGLRKVYPNGIEAVRDLSFQVARGEIYGLLGPNGAGKSTTVGVLTTTVGSWTGTAHVAGYDVARDPLRVRAVSGVVFQDSVLDNEFTGRDNLELHARLWRVPASEAAARIEELLAVMGLGDRADDGVRTYSGGMRRRLEIARALLARPRVLFLDEPTTGLDPQIRAEIWQIITRLRQHDGVTIVVSTHYLEEAESVCDRVGIIHRGRLVDEGAPRELVDDLGPDMVELRVAVSADADRVAGALAATGLGRHSPSVRGEHVTMPVADRRLSLDDVNRTLAPLSSDGLGVVASTLRRATLADVFTHRTREPAEAEAEPEEAV